MVFGPVSYGWSGFLTLQDAPDSADANQSLGTFLDFYLDQMKYIEHRNQERLFDVLDVHWYPEALGDNKRITLNDILPPLSPPVCKLLEAFGIASYMEKSWITDSTHQPIRLIPWLQEKIDRHYPGTKIAITEYDYGAGDNISGDWLKRTHLEYLVEL